jgi:hypothetical protein
MNGFFFPFYIQHHHEFDSDFQIHFSSDDSDSRTSEDEE